MTIYAITNAAGVIQRYEECDAPGTGPGEFAHAVSSVNGAGAQPSPLHALMWDGLVGSEWVDTGTLQQARDLKWAEVKAQRDALEFGPIVWEGVVFDGDSASRRRITDARDWLEDMVAQGLLTEIEWTLADNSTRPMTVADLTGVIRQGGIDSALAFGRARELRVAIDAASTVAAIQALSW